jgi:branched-chain amino acid transport system ATP-binding protein
VSGLTVRHGQLEALSDVGFALGAGETVALIGANGAGKSTLLRTIAGLHRPSRGSVTFDGQDITRLPAHARVALGVVLVPEGRRLFASLTLEENLLIGATRARPGSWNVDRVIGLFPWMAERRSRPTIHLSGGEQQAVAIGRALMANPRVLLLDELSLGLAPALVQRLYDVLPQLLEGGMAILLVEQDVTQALRVSERVHCLLEGRITLTGKPEELSPAQVETAYFGLAARTPGGG